MVSIWCKFSTTDRERVSSALATMAVRRRLLGRSGNHFNRRGVGSDVADSDAHRGWQHEFHRSKHSRKRTSLAHATLVWSGQVAGRGLRQSPTASPVVFVAWSATNVWSNAVAGTWSIVTTTPSGQTWTGASVTDSGNSLLICATNSTLYSSLSGGSTGPGQRLAPLRTGPGVRLWAHKPHSSIIWHGQTADSCIGAATAKISSCSHSPSPY